MSNGVIIHLDNEEGILADSANLFKQLNIDLELITCKNKDEFEIVLNERGKDIKTVIFDLLGQQASKEELYYENSLFLNLIEKMFINFNVPIFIYSGYLQNIENRFENNGTVFKVDKAESCGYIFDKIKLFHESGFLDIFCRNGVFENDLFKDINQAFIKQFTDNSQIECVINQIISNTEETKKKQTIEKVFKRIAIRSLLTKLHSPETDSSGNLIEGYLNSTEHYVQRISSIEIWTGDIFKNKETGDYIFILTPRCNVIRDENILYCPFKIGDIIKKDDKIDKMLQGDPTVSGYDRYLPPSPMFKGGKIQLSKYQDFVPNNVVN